MSFWDVLWFIVISFGFVAYLMLLFWILGHLFCNRKQSGGIKAIWVILLILFPYLTALDYLIVHGDGMTERSSQAALAAKDAQDSYIREIAGKTPTDQIVDAKAFLVPAPSPRVSSTRSRRRPCADDVGPRQGGQLPLQTC